jgi:hypothetical protein
MSRPKNYGSPSPGAVILMSNSLMKIPSRNQFSCAVVIPRIMSDSRYLSLTLPHKLPNHEDDECDYGDRNDNTGPHTHLKNVADNITAGH